MKQLPDPIDLPLLIRMQPVLGSLKARAAR